MDMDLSSQLLAAQISQGRSFRAPIAIVKKKSHEMEMALVQMVDAGGPFRPPARPGDQVDKLA